MLYRGRRYVNTCFVSVMRQLFKEHPQYPWSSNFLESKIFIDEAFPRGKRKFPCIICTDVTDGEFFSTSFDRNFQEDVKDEYGNIIGSVYGITIKPTIQISVSALTKFDVEMISDYICGYMQYYGINKFADAGITILSASGSTPSTEEYGKNNIYTINLTYNLQAEWQKFVSLLDDTVERIVIPEIGILYGEDYKERQKEDGIIIDPSIESGDNE